MSSRSQHIMTCRSSSILIPPLIQTDTHGRNDAHIHIRGNRDEICLLATEQLPCVPPFPLDPSHRHAGIGANDVGFRVEEIAVHLELDSLPVERISEMDDGFGAADL